MSVKGDVRIGRCRYLQGFFGDVCTPEGSGEVVHGLCLQVARVGQVGPSTQVYHGPTPASGLRAQG